MISPFETTCQTGGDLVDVISSRFYGFDVPAFLSKQYGLTGDIASEITNQVDSAEVNITNLGSLAVNSPRIVGNEPNVKTLKKVIFPKQDAMIINAEVANLLAEKMHRDGMSKAREDQDTKAANQIAAVFELGRFVSNKIYSHRGNDPARPLPLGHSADFYDQVASDLEARLISVSIDANRDNSDPASVYYKDNLLVERVCSAGGIKLVDFLYPSLSIDVIKSVLQSTVYGQLVVTPENPIIPKFELPWPDIAAANPLSEHDYFTALGIERRSNVVALPR